VHDFLSAHTKRLQSGIPFLAWPGDAMAYDTDNVFARILRGEIPCFKVHEDQHTLAFMDLMPQSDGHTLIIPKYEATNLFELPTPHLHHLISNTQRIAAAAQHAFHADGVTLMQFNGAAAGQTVFHIHFHIVPRFIDRPMIMHGRSMADKDLLAQHAEQLRQALA
jgi:histidine triad (HIT) family protein